MRRVGDNREADDARAIGIHWSQGEETEPSSLRFDCVVIRRCVHHAIQAVGRTGVAVGSGSEVVGELTATATPPDLGYRDGCQSRATWATSVRPRRNSTGHRTPTAARPTGHTDEELA